MVEFESIFLYFAWDIECQALHKEFFFFFNMMNNEFIYIIYLTVLCFKVFIFKKYDYNWKISSFENIIIVSFLFLLINGLLSVDTLHE